MKGTRNWGLGIGAQETNSSTVCFLALDMVVRGQLTSKEMGWIRENGET